MAARFASELALASKEIGRIRADLAHADALALSSAPGYRDRAASAKAAIYVWSASLLEAVIRNALQASVREITAFAPALARLKPSLFSLVCDPEFESIYARKPSNTWEVRTKIFERVFDMSAALLADTVLPLDGRTLRGEHFDRIWLVFGIPGASLPTPLHRLALKDLADGRNEVAHGHVDPVTFGRTKATADLQRLISRTDDVVAHVLTGLDDYLNKQNFLR